LPITPTYIFVFLPLTLLLYLIPRQGWRNTWLLVASLVFYTWDALSNLSWYWLILANYLLGRGWKHPAERPALEAGCWR
jgi:hypothetical protein